MREADVQEADMQEADGSRPPRDQLQFHSPDDLLQRLPVVASSCFPPKEECAICKADHNDVAQACTEKHMPFLQKQLLCQRQRF